MQNRVVHGPRCEPMSATPTDTDDDPAPIPPVPPDDDACCGNGCDPCIYDLYGMERDRYLAALRAWQERQAQRRGGGAPSP